MYDRNVNNVYSFAIPSQARPRLGWEKEDYSEMTEGHGLEEIWGKNRRVGEGGEEGEEEEKKGNLHYFPGKFLNNLSSLI